MISNDFEGLLSLRPPKASVKMPPMRFSLKILAFLTAYLLSQMAQADFGNKFVANKRLSTKLDNATKKLSYRFTCQEDMTLTAASVFCLEALASPAYQLSLQEDDKGSPSGNPLALSSFVPHGGSWSTLSLAAVSLYKGKIYHLVLEVDLLRGGGHPVALVGPLNRASFVSTDVLNHLFPNDGSPDPYSNTLSFEDGKWKVLDREPVYALYGSGYHFQGNPYDDPGEKPIYANVLAGQTLHFHCGYPVKDLGFRVRKQGNPTTPLNYVILSHNYRIHKCKKLYSAVALRPDQASSDFKWVSVGGVPPDLGSFPAECYYFVLQSDAGHPSKNAPGCEDCYVLSDLGNSGGLSHAADLSFDGGAHLSRATQCPTGDIVAGWIDQFERDANVVAIGPVCPSPQGRDFSPLPTPLPIEAQPRLNP